MLYACSILYKTKLPMILVFNKTDVKDAEFAKKWMTDFEAFQAALCQEEEAGAFGGVEGGGVGGMGGGSGYMGSFLNSMSLMLEEFYRHLSLVGVSSMTGDGIDEFFEAVEEKRKEFERDYKPELEKKMREREEAKEARREVELGKLLKDMNVSGSSRPDGAGGSMKIEEPDTVSEAEEEEDPDEYEDVKPGNGDMGLGDDGGLEERYKHALEESAPKPSKQEQDVARYLRSSNIG
ncbi:GTPase NPA3 [Paracoccidioides brasiliensis Pb18]|uniref:GPN-loop GTPase n=1 Tax=Paracoccidioides brasiliensis (strain Pb18) TaxID=502780 RepID=C1G4B1_PARBD|nr:GTPase NPA3 [Paracoccidioides brasiliensis Pb18]EEH45627.1 hypothetical protein PADG_01777 [Paracoccidioides brasiliensis Pb18]